MIDGFANWKLMQDHMLAAQKAQVEAMTKLMGMGTNFAGAAKAAQQVAENNTRAWEAWLAMWGAKP